MMKLLILIICLLFTNMAVASPTEVYWEDLVPENYIAPQPQINHQGSMKQLHLNAPVVNKYDGKQVMIPGFVVPLEGDSELTTEFLLVPYFGACIHVPPPPPNQIVYVTFEKGVAIGALTDAVWITGILSTEGWSGEVATVGYTLRGSDIQPFDG